MCSNKQEHWVVIHMHGYGIESEAHHSYEEAEQNAKELLAISCLKTDSVYSEDVVVDDDSNVVKTYSYDEGCSILICKN